MPTNTKKPIFFLFRLNFKRTSSFNLFITPLMGELFHWSSSHRTVTEGSLCCTAKHCSRDGLRNVTPTWLFYIRNVTPTWPHGIWQVTQSSVHYTALHKTSWNSCDTWKHILLSLFAVHNAGDATRRTYALLPLYCSAQVLGLPSLLSNHISNSFPVIGNMSYVLTKNLDYARHATGTAHITCLPDA